MMILPTRLKKLRETTGKSLDVVRREIGISTAHLSKLENIQVNPGLLMACVLADYYGVSLDELLDHKPGTRYIK